MAVGLFSVGLPSTSRKRAEQAIDVPSGRLVVASVCAAHGYVIIVDVNHDITGSRVAIEGETAQRPIAARAPILQGHARPHRVVSLLLAFTGRAGVALPNGAIGKIPVVADAFSNAIFVSPHIQAPLGVKSPERGHPDGRPRSGDLASVDSKCNSQRLFIQVHRIAWVVDACHQAINRVA